MHHSPLTSAWIVVGDSDFFIVVYLCLFFTSLVLLRVFELSLGKAMGNENSTLSSECSTPPSDFLEYESLYSVTTDNRGGSSRPSTRAPSPMEPPEPDLSHLTPEEIAQIKAVMDRAKDMQVDEQKRVRQLEEDYIEYATRIEREASLTELNECGPVTCPICNKETIIDLGNKTTGSNMCVDCEKLTCVKCGNYNISLTTKAQEWVCQVCERRRKLLMSSGLWYHGSHPETDLPLEKELVLPPNPLLQQPLIRDRSPLRPTAASLPEPVPRTSRSLTPEIVPGTGTNLPQVSPKQETHKYESSLRDAKHQDTLKYDSSLSETRKPGSAAKEQSKQESRKSDSWQMVTPKQSTGKYDSSSRKEISEKDIQKHGSSPREQPKQGSQKGVTQPDVRQYDTSQHELPAKEFAKYESGENQRDMRTHHSPSREPSKREVTKHDHSKHDTSLRNPLQPEARKSDHSVLEQSTKQAERPYAPNKCGTSKKDSSSHVTSKETSLSSEHTKDMRIDNSTQQDRPDQLKQVPGKLEKQDTRKYNSSPRDQLQQESGKLVTSLPESVKHDTRKYDSPLQELTLPVTRRYDSSPGELLLPDSLLPDSSPRTASIQDIFKGGSSPKLTPSPRGPSPNVSMESATSPRGKSEIRSGTVGVTPLEVSKHDQNIPISSACREQAIVEQRKEQAKSESRKEYTKGEPLRQESSKSEIQQPEISKQRGVKPEEIKQNITQRGFIQHQSLKHEPQSQKPSKAPDPPKRESEKRKKDLSHHPSAQDTLKTTKPPTSVLPPDTTQNTNVSPKHKHKPGPSISQDKSQSSVSSTGPQTDFGLKHKPNVNPKHGLDIESNVCEMTEQNLKRHQERTENMPLPKPVPMDKSGQKIKPQVAPKPIPPPKRIPRSSSVEDKSVEKDLSKVKKSTDVVKDSSAATDKQKLPETSSGASKEPPVPPPKTTRGFPNGKPKLFPGPIVHQRLEPVDAHGNKIEKKGKGDNKNKKTDRLQKSSSIETAPSRLKGTGSKSDSDDFSDLASDLDMEEIYGERYRADGASTDEAWDDMSISTVSNDDADSSTFRRKYRPKSLNLSRSHSLTSSDEEESLEAAIAPAAEVATNLNQVPKPKPTHPPPVAKKPDLRLAPIVTEEPRTNLTTSSLEIHECKAINSPTPPRSPSWREGLESPPFSPKRKDHYPGKKRSGSASPTSPKEKRHHFNYSDLSPPSRQPSVDELYGDQGPSKDTTAPLINMAQKPSPLSPEEIPNSIIGTSGEPFSFSMPVRDKFKTDLSCFQPAKIVEDIHDQVQVMDLATYAATIASSTASLTSMSVSPTTLQVNASCYNNEHGSPESNDSPDSNSPVSPGYYDNVSNSGDMEDVELADPSTKSIDYQGSKRQKARPPTTDWSPVIDLSPILDVSPSIEEAEQEDMLMKQREEFLRQKSREEEIERAEAAMAEQDEEEEEEEMQPTIDEVQPPIATVPAPVDQYLYRSLRRYGNFEDMSKIGDNGLTLSTLSDELNGNDPNYHIEDSPPKDEFAMMHCASLAQTLSTESTPHYSKSPVFQGDTVGDSAHHKSVLETITSIEIRKISQDLEEIARKGVAEFKPLPPPKPRRKLPEPGVESTPKKIPPIPAPKPTMPVPKTVPTEESKLPISDEPKTVSEDRQLQKQDSFEKRTAKYLKARPNPILVEHIESEEQSVSPQYKVLDSPPTPEQKPIKREFSESTSVSPSSSPDQDVYMFPSPVTPPDSDSSPPKPHSPSSTGTDLDDDASHKSSRDDLMGLDEPVPTSTAKQSPIKPLGTKPVSQPIPIPSDAEKIKEKISKFEKISDSQSDHSREQKKEAKKIRRKLPPIPVGEEPVLKPKAKIRGTKQSKQQHTENKVTNGSYRKSSTISQSDDSMNEEDMEVARITKHSASKRKPISDVGKAKSFDVSPQTMKGSKTHAEAQRLLRACSVGSSQKVGPKDETDAIIDSLISIYNIPITEAMKSLKKRLQEELRKVTRDRKRKIEELEEIRALQMQIGALQLDARHAARVRNGKRSPAPKQYEPPPTDTRKRGGLSPSSSSQTPRSSPQVTPRRQRHKRQSSDPMIAKFSPIKEDRDIESDFQSKIDSADARQSKYSTDDSSQSGLSDCDSTRSEPITNVRYKKIKPSAYARMFYTGKGTPADRGQPDHREQQGPQNQLSVSRSESQITAGYRSGSGSGSRTPSYYSDDEEMKAKEEKKAQLQYEIDKRKRQLEETARLKHELLKLARARQALAHSYDDIPGRYGSGDYQNQYRSYGPQRPIPTGIIRPIDDEPDEMDMPHSRRDDRSRRRQNAYSSTEYLVHKHESRRYKSDEASIYSDEQHYSDGYNDMEAESPPRMPRRMEASYPSATPSRDARMSASVTLPDMYHTRGDIEYIPTRDAFSVYSGSEGSPASDYTPAMPLLDDVMAKSRKIIREIGSGSRPVSAEFNLDGGVEDLMNAMYRVESDNSVDADEPIMKHMTEGGVTILKQLDRKKKTPSKDPIRYPFPTKRILVTRDPKDRSVTGTTGNGLGMKIVGGKQIPGTKETGAYVTAIYSGGVADQLHGELEVGDQVLEWNGVTLSGKSYEDVQQIISQPNGEIEMVVRPLAFPSSSKRPTGHSNSCHSSYDNLDLPCSDDELGDKSRSSVSPKGVDPQQLAAQLEEIREDVSPENSPASSQHEFPTPSVSSPCSTPLSDPTSTPSDKHQRVVHEKVASQAHSAHVSQGQGHPGHQSQLVSSSTSSASHTSHTTHSTPSSHSAHTSNTPPQTAPSHRSTQRVQSPPTSHHGIHQGRKGHSPKRSTHSPNHARRSPSQTGHSPSRASHSPSQASHSTSQASHSSGQASHSPGLASQESRTSHSRSPSNNQESNGQGEIQIQISHDDYDNTLNVHVIQARNLKPRDLNGLSDPFVKIYLLPGRGAENKRRTKHIPRTLFPEWHQTLIFPNLAREELKNKVLEITVWDYDRFKTNDFLGELIIEMDEVGFLDNKPHWYPLRDHVLQQGFQLPKSSVPPPLVPSEDDNSKSGKKGEHSKSPRHHKRHPTRPKKEENGESSLGPRRRSLDTLDESGQSRNSQSRKSTRQIASAHASPSPRRRSRDSRSPNKSRSSEDVS